MFWRAQLKTRKRLLLNKDREGEGFRSGWRVFFIRISSLSLKSILCGIKVSAVGGEKSKPFSSISNGYKKELI